MHLLPRVAPGRFARSVRLGVAMLALGALTAPAAARAATPASSPGPLLWTAPGGVDTQPIDGMACPSTVLCVAVDHGGQVLWSTDPAGGPRAWAVADPDGAMDMTGVSCPSTTLCVAVDGAGNVITSTDPTGGAAAWVVTHVDPSATENNTDNAGPVLVRGVSCTIGLCVAVDAAGNALVSADPTGGAAAWTIVHADTATSYGCTGTGLACQPPLTAIACPSSALCAAVDFSGNLLTSANPTALAPWESTPTDAGGLSSLFAISCPSASFCAMVDGDTGRVITVNPLAPAAQVVRSLPDSLYGIWCESSSLCLASAQTGGGISGLLGSFDPAAPGSTWSLSGLGGVNAISCPAASLCLAADDEGNIAAGETTKAITRGLRAELLSGRHLPTIAALAKTARVNLTSTSPIAARVQVAWTAGTTAQPLTIASASHRFMTPGVATLRLSPTRAGRRLFRAARARLTLTASATFAASTGSVTSSRKLTLSRPVRHKSHKR